MIGYVPIVNSWKLFDGSNPDAALFHIEIGGHKYPCGVVFNERKDAVDLTLLPDMDVAIAVVEFDEVPQAEELDGIFFPRWFSACRFLSWF